MSRWIGVDLDGTLAYYSGWGNGQIGEPIPLMASRVRKWLADGHEVRIFTARVATVGGGHPMEVEGKRDDANDQRKLIQDWTEKHFGVRLPVTATKDFAMIELWDDRAIQVKLNTGERADGYP